MFTGSIVALITPFSNNSPDESALVRLVRFHLDNGTHAIVPVGTTGEASTLSRREHERVIDIVVQEVGGQVPVIAGAYNRPHQEGIYQHFRALDARTKLPVIVYNVPPRTIIDILPETMARLAQLENIVGVKDASCDLSRPLKERLLIGDEFCLITGEDQTAVAYNANGGQGCISVTANVAPALCAELQNACASQDYGLALDIQLRLMPLHMALFSEPSPAGAKYACSLLGLNQPVCRLPIVQLTQTTKTAIEDAMLGLGLI